MVGGHGSNDVVVDRQYFLIVSTSTQRIDDAVIHALQGLRITDTAGHLPDKNLSGRALRTLGTADVAAVTWLAKGKNCLNAILLIGTQRIPAIRSVTLQRISRHEANTRLNTKSLVAVHIDRATVGSA